MEPSSPEPLPLKVELRARRHSLGLTQAEVADLAGCNVRFVTQLERGKTTVRLDKLLSVLAALGLEVALRLRQAR